METFKVQEDWATFKQFILNHLKNVYKKAIGFMYRDKEIIIRSKDNSVLDIIREYYTITPCEQPSNFLDKDNGWDYFGNHRLFENKI